MQNIYIVPVLTVIDFQTDAYRKTSFEEFMYELICMLVVCTTI